MKKYLKLALTTFVSLIFFTGCGAKVNSAEHLEDYIKTMDYHDNFVILQLTDIHWNSGTQIGNAKYGQKEYLDKLIAEVKSHTGKIDLIEVTGDTFMLSNKIAVKSFLKYMEGVGIPYATIWGNHDRQGIYNPNWISKKFMSAPYSLYTEIDNDDVHERGNYVINLKDKDGKVAWQLIELDSGASYRTKGTDLSLTYDYLRQDQLDWMAKEHALAGENVPAIAYYHIVQKETVMAFDALQAGTFKNKNKFYKLEDFGASKFAATTEEVFAKNNVKAAFMGHDHSIDWTYTSDTGIVYGFGVKTGEELYWTSTEDNFHLIGASVLTLNNPQGDFTLEHLYFNENKNDNFVKWVEY